MMNPKRVAASLAVVALLAIAAPALAQIAPYEPGPGGGGIAAPAGVHRGADPDQPQRDRVTQQSESQAPAPILTSCTMCDYSGGNDWISCGICAMFKRFWAMGGW